MILLDTDTLTLFFQGHARGHSRVRAAEADVATTIISWIEVMQGRFDAILKAADAHQPQRAHERLHDSARQLATLTIVPVDDLAALQFEKLLMNKKLKKITSNRPSTLMVVKARGRRRFQSIVDRRRTYQELSCQTGICPVTFS